MDGKYKVGKWEARGGSRTDQLSPASLNPGDATGGHTQNALKTSARPPTVDRHGHRIRANPIFFWGGGGWG